MPRTTLSITSFSHRPNKKKTLGNLDTSLGRGLLDIFEDFCRTVLDDNFVDVQKQHYIKLVGTERVGRAVFATFESGYYGNPGTTYDVKTHKVVHKRSKHESATTLTRLGLVLPPAGHTALFFFEREGSYGAGPRVFDMFKEALMDGYPNDYFPAQVVVEPDAWQANADLRKVTVTANQWSSTIGGSVSPINIPLGELRQELKPSGGAGFFPRKVRDAILKRQISMSVYLGLPDDFETETKVELVNDGRPKTFVIGRDKTPSVLLWLTDEGSPRLRDLEIQQKIFVEAASYYDQNGLSWNSTWEVGKATWVQSNVTWNHKFA